jgi:hypothetical protein
MLVAREHVPASLAERVARMLERFGIEGRRAEILGCLDLVCGESLRAGAGRSSLNADGTPLQLALSLAAGRPACFEFVGEVFAPEAEAYEARRRVAINCMREVSDTIGVRPELGAVGPRLEALAGTGQVGDGEDPAGAFWLGASFPPSDDAAMTVYANVRRGSEADRWKRLAAFVGGIGNADWSSLLAIVETGGLSPLGAGVHLRAGRGARARLYFRSYGLRPSEHRRIFDRAGSGAEFDRALEVFFEELLGEERSRPTRSMVVSFGCDAEGPLVPKLELCAHCAWKTDAEATLRCQGWLRRIGIDSGLYRDALGIVTDGREAPHTTMTHVFVGLGMKPEGPYASIYLNPGRDA